MKKNVVLTRAIPWALRHAKSLWGQRVDGAVLATLTGNGLNQPLTAAFDGQRILVTDSTFGAEGVSLWKAADFNPLGFIPTEATTSPDGACSDGVNFRVTLEVANQLMRF